MGAGEPVVVGSQRPRQRGIAWYGVDSNRSRAMPDPIVQTHNAAVAECRAAVVAALAAVKADPSLTLADAESVILDAIDALRTDR